MAGAVGHLGAWNQGIFCLPTLTDGPPGREGPRGRCQTDTPAGVNLAARARHTSSNSPEPSPVPGTGQTTELRRDALGTVARSPGASHGGPEERSRTAVFQTMASAESGSLPALHL